MSVCFTEYVSETKKCEKTDDVSKVTCAYCIGRLFRDNRIKITPTK